MDKKQMVSTEKGQSLVEMAFSLVILLTLLGGIVDLGRAFFNYMALRDAVQEGAIYGSINPTLPVEIKNHVLNNSDMISGMIGPEDINVEVIGSACTGNAIRVTAVYDDFPIAMPFMGAIIGSQYITIRASVTDTILSPSCE